MPDELPWIQWYPSKWLGDTGLRQCSSAARGLWIDMLMYMHTCTPYGHFVIRGKAPTCRQIVSLIGGITETQVKARLLELETAGVFDRTEEGVIVNRRMTRDNHRRVTNKVNGQNGGNPNFLRGTVPKDQRVRPYKRSDSPEKTLRIWNRTNGHCYHCGIKLQSEHHAHDFFHVDHLIAIRDGGTNDEDNLVASCARCNHDRAHVNPTVTDDTNPNSNSDPKPDNKAREEKRREEKRRERETRGRANSHPPKGKISEDWLPDEDGVAYAKSAGIADVVGNVRKFVNRYVAGGDEKADWQAQWRFWCDQDSSLRKGAK